MKEEQKEKGKGEGEGEGGRGLEISKREKGKEGERTSSLACFLCKRFKESRPN